MNQYEDKYPSRLLSDAVEAISSLPGVGRRSALRLALHLLRQPSEEVHRFTGAIDRLRDETRYCRTCMMISDTDECPICADRSRDRRTVCIVENVRDVMSIEATGQYHGVYHVLGGIISPINGVGPSDLTIGQLVERISALAGLRDGGGAVFGESDSENADSGSRATPDSAGEASACDLSEVEVILALSGDVEGDTTAFYIYRQLEKFNVRFSTLARGLGFGDDIEYADALTLGRSIAGRVPFKA